MKYMKALYLIMMIAIVINCKGKKPKKEENSKLKKSFSIEEKHFLQQKMDSTMICNFAPGDSIQDDLNSSEKEKCILTRDAAHKYKLVSIQKKSDKYIGIIVLYVMEGGNKQFFITLDEKGKAISDLLVQNSHADGPLKLADGNILQFSGVSSRFNEDTIFVVEKRFMSDGFSPGAKEWEETIENKYLITDEGRFTPLKH